VEKHPDVAREIVRRGHEAAAHGKTWESTFALSRDDEKKNISDGAEIVERVTGFHPVGWTSGIIGPRPPGRNPIARSGA
jgi:peptidoglycan/xylan/chitin deacetylase (PgdA/CDA1 family)